MTTQAPNVPSAPDPVPVSPPAAPTPVSKPGGSEFGFNYEGPIEARQTPGCNLCIAALGMQPPHNCMPGCAVCAAGRTKVCTSHQGMKVAFDAAGVPKEFKALFDSARTTVETALAGAAPAANVKVRIFGQVGLPDTSPRTMTVEVTLLG